MKIYTKFGDQGKTRLVGGSSVEKSDPRVDSYGTVDELNSFLGLAISEMGGAADDGVSGAGSGGVHGAASGLANLRAELLRIQHELFDLGSLLACDKTELMASLPKIEAENISRLEKSIDEMSRDLAPLKNFILPGGSRLASLLHVCRTTCRRAERATVALKNEIITADIAAEVHSKTAFAPPLERGLVYLNRLSDYFFTAARFANFKLGVEDQLWQKSSAPAGGVKI